MGLLGQGLSMILLRQNMKILAEKLVILNSYFQGFQSKCCQIRSSPWAFCVNLYAFNQFHKVFKFGKSTFYQKFEVAVISSARRFQAQYFLFID